MPGCGGQTIVRVFVIYFVGLQYHLQPVSPEVRMQDPANVFGPSVSAKPVSAGPALSMDQSSTGIFHKARSLAGRMRPLPAEASSSRPADFAVKSLGIPPFGHPPAHWSQLAVLQANRRPSCAKDVQPEAPDFPQAVPGRLLAKQPPCRWRYAAHPAAQGHSAATARNPGPLWVRLHLCECLHFCGPQKAP